MAARSIAHSVPSGRIDAHQHFWKYDSAQYSWIDDSMQPLRRDYLPDESVREMRTAGFDGCVAVQARQTIDETQWLLSLADHHPSIVGVVGWVDLRAANVAAQLRALEHPKLVGIRHIVQSEPDDFLARPDFRRGIAALEAFDLVYDILVYSRQMGAAIDLAEAFPDQRFVLDHLGKPPIRRGELAEWQRDLRRLASCPNVWCKLSGLVTEADWTTWTDPQIAPYLETAFECFGVDRLMIGSDWPVCTLAGSYRRVMEVVIRALEPFTTTERDHVLGGTAARVWKLAVPARQV